MTKKIQLFKEPKSPKEWDQLSNYEKFRGACEGFKDILNPTLCEKFLMLTNRYVDEEREKIRAEVISPELREIEQKLLKYRESVNSWGTDGHIPGVYLNQVIEKIKELYGAAKI